eukprot:TRINITY_DN7764_c0_g1_i3.p1 TRINITY_DN7764_c0_g1~~TRINITY_DN7764_c0_g1_i3.p1  ORF type:complete len:600 (+),score=85.66 TRINITY_DN7764_c0_g1_i3:96-1802(+)
MENAFPNFKTLTRREESSFPISNCFPNSSSEKFSRMELQIKDSHERASHAKKNIMWTRTMDRCLINLLAEQVYLGRRIENGFHKDAWTSVVQTFNARCGTRLNKGHFKNRLKTWRKIYPAVKALLSQNGFGWDEKHEMVYANDQVWDAYIKMHPDAKQYRNKVVPSYHKMALIIGNDVSNGSHSRTGGEIKINDYASGLKDVDVMDPAGSLDPEHEGDNMHESESSDRGVDGSPQGYTHQPAASSSSKLSDRQKSPTEGRDALVKNSRAGASNSKNIMWTSTMDGCLTDLLLEQVYLGRKIDNGFHKDAWKVVVPAFNARCGMKLGKEHFKNRLRTWRKIYLSVKALLDHSGFRWDDKHKMVFAEDHVWDEYIKEHPEASKYRYKVIRRYCEMAVIMGNDVADGSPLRIGADFKMNGNGRALEDLDGMDPAGSVDPEHMAVCLHESDHSDRDVDGSSQGGIQQPATSSTSKPCKRRKKSIAEGISQSLAEMARALRMLAEGRERAEKANKPTKMKILFDEVKKIPNIDNRFIFAALEFLASDQNRAEMFLAIDEDMRHEWLLLHVPPW